MNYALRIPGDVSADLRRLNPQFAEEILDAIEAAAANPGQLETDLHGEAILEVHRLIGGVPRLAFLHFHRDDHRHVLTLLRLLAPPSHA